MREMIGMALAISLATSGGSAANAADQWTGAYGGMQLDTFNYNAEGRTDTQMRKLDARILTIRGFLGHDWQLSKNFLVGAEAGIVWHSDSTEIESRSKYKISSGYLIRSRAGLIINNALLYGILGYGIYEGKFDRSDPIEFLAVDSDTIEYGIGLESLYKGWVARLEYVFLNFGSPEDVLDYDATSSKLGVGMAYRF